MAQLAIKGHKARGKEIIEFLRMLGGMMNGKILGTEGFCGYYIDSNGNIDYKHYSYFDDAIQFTLEEFLKKFPYKVGDKVFAFGNKCTIIDAVWDGSIEEVVYTIKSDTSEYTTTKLSNQLQPYKEETMEERQYKELRIPLDDDDKLATEVTIDGNKILPPNGYLIGKITQLDNGMFVEYVKKQPQYPKTYVECCEVLVGRKPNPNEISFDKMELCLVDLDNTQSIDFQNPYLSQLNSLFRLRMCRDAYWKIAGEQMGLGKPWKPDFDNLSTNLEYIKIVKGCFTYSSRVFAFPTKEMRDAFHENFKELIEECKELL